MRSEKEFIDPGTPPLTYSLVNHSALKNSDFPPLNNSIKSPHSVISVMNFTSVMKKESLRKQQNNSSISPSQKDLQTPEIADGEIDSLEELKDLKAKLEGIRDGFDKDILSERENKYLHAHLGKAIDMVINKISNLHLKSIEYQSLNCNRYLRTEKKWVEGSLWDSDMEYEVSGMPEKMKRDFV